MSELTHFDEHGASRMVDTSAKPETLREARASGLVRMAPATAALIRDRGLAKGDVLEVHGAYTKSFNNQAQVNFGDRTKLTKLDAEELPKTPTAFHDLAIADLKEEMALVQRETDKLLSRAGIPMSLPAEMTEVLVTTFHELRSGQSADGAALEQLTTAMSTAEAISTGYAAGLHAYYYGGGRVRGVSPWGRPELRPRGRPPRASAPAPTA